LCVHIPENRIEVNNIKFNVIDIDSVYITIMKKGKWASSDNYSARIVKNQQFYYRSDLDFFWIER